MTRRCLAILLLVAIVAPAGASAQTGGGSNPFGPLPQTPQAPPEQPKPKKVNSPDANDDGLGGTAFWLIIGATGGLFVVVAFVIMRDSRRTLGRRGKSKRRMRGTGRPAADAAKALAGAGGRHEPGSHKARAKAQQRAKTKAARKQRRQTRSR